MKIKITGNGHRTKNVAMVQLWGNSSSCTFVITSRKAAATSTKIDGVTHEFDTVPGVREDVMKSSLI